MKKIFLLLLIPLLTILSIKVHAACPAAGSVSVTATSTPRTCGGNGTITATFSPNTEVSLQLLKGGTIISQVSAPPALSSPYTWTALQPGTDYQVRIICAEDNGIIYQTVNVSVADNYVPISDADIAISNLCTNFSPGGTFTINGVTGGNAPYEYSLVLDNDPNFTDVVPSNYTTNNVMNVTEYGTYQIRIKDACGNYKTFTRTLSATLPPIQVYWRPKKVCNSNQATGHIWYSMDPLTNSATYITNYLPQGVKMVIRDTNASGAILFNGTYTGAPFTYTESPTHSYYITTTNSCGISTSYTHTLNNPINNPEFDNFEVVTSTSGCGSSELMSISSNLANQNYWNYPIAVTVSNSGGTVHTTTVYEGGSWHVDNLPIGVYTVKYVDVCGDSLTKTVANPQNAGTPVLTLHSVMNWRCGDILPLTENGYVQAQVIISGYMPDKANAVVTITSGPNSVGVAGTYVDGTYWAWNNLLPGTYQVSFTSCGVTHTGSFTISPNDSNILKQSLSSAGTSFCSGGGNITSNKVYNGNHAATVELLNSLGAVIQTSDIGTFNNLAPGTYTTRMKIETWCGNQYDYYLPGSTVTLTNSSTGPKITASTGVICEGSTGNPLTTGSIYLNVAGVAPYEIDYRVAGSAAPYTTINTSLSSVQINNLAANIIYEVILRDACGGAFPTTVQIKTMGALTASNTSQPCNNAPYTLIMPYYAGASYEWSNPSGTVISNSRTHTISNYIPSNNGTYVCKITWTNCVTRYVNLSLNSTLCGGTIGDCGTVDSDGDGVFDGCDQDDDNDGILDCVEKGLDDIGNTFKINGDAIRLSATEATLAPDTANQTGQMWSKGKVDFSKSFTLSYEAYFGTKNNGADGIATVFHNSPAGTSAIGLSGSGIGASGIANGIVLELDTFDNSFGGTITTTTGDIAADHGMIWDTDNQAGAGLLSTAVALPNLEDGNYHDVIITWNHTTQTISYTLDGITAGSYTGDLINNYFGGASKVYFGYTASTGSDFNLHKIRITDPCNDLPLILDTDDDGIPNHLDLDSDNDGCLDAIEGDENVTVAQLVNASGTVTVGASSTAANQNLGNTIDTNGVPTIVNYGGAADIGGDVGQGVGSSNDLTINTCFCFKPGISDAGNTYPTKHGITVLGRAGAENQNWPMTRQSAWTVLESKEKGFVVNRVTTTANLANITNPVEGMMVYDEQADCLKVYTLKSGETVMGWHCFITPACPD